MAERSHTPRPRAGARTQVLVVERDAAVARLIKGWLWSAGYGVALADSVADMRAAVMRTPFDLVILDSVLPDQDGWSALRWLRARGTAPVIVLTGGDRVDAVVARELGAEDSLAKPVDEDGLLARLSAIQQRRDTAEMQVGASTDEYRFADWTLDIVSQRLRSGTGETMHLTQAEYRILSLLARNPRRVVSRSELMKAAAGRDWEPFDRSIDVHVSNLRRKIDPNPAQPSLIRTVRSAGYMFVPSRGI